MVLVEVCCWAKYATLPSYLRRHKLQRPAKKPFEMAKRTRF